MTRASDGTRVVRNELRRRGPSSPFAFHRRLPDYAPTPMVDASTLGAALGLASLHVKDESQRLGLPAFKILGASWATYRLLCERLGEEPDWSTLDALRDAFVPLGALTLVAATDGNHGRAVARVARWFGYRARILMPFGAAPARVAGIESEGAEVTVIDGSYDEAVEQSAALADDTTLVVSDTSWEGYTDVPRWVIEGYRTIFREADLQLEQSPDVIVVQMGVGALAAAVVEHYAGIATIVVVEPVNAACGLHSAAAGHPVDVPGPHDSIMAGMNCGRVSIVAWPLLAHGVDIFLTVDDAAAEAAMRSLADVGVVAGETGAAGVAGLRTLATHATEADLDLSGAHAVVLCTEGATDPDAYRRIVGREP